MALQSLFDHEKARREEEILASGDGTAQLSVVVVENDFVGRVYEKLAIVYDLAFGPTLQPGRRRAIAQMPMGPGVSVLEVGVGTGMNIDLYPPECAVVGIDLSGPMLEKAHSRIMRKDVRNIRLIEMDAAHLKFADKTFDIVYAPYVISVVPDPVAVVREMHRVCKTGGRLVMLNHFRSANPMLAWCERILSPFTVHIGFKADLDLPGFLAQAGLEPVSIEKVNTPRIWSLVTCIKA
ncbi:MAG: methyltransferase domain-containing protein [Vicinamibacterales bacterium]